MITHLFSVRVCYLFSQLNGGYDKMSLHVTPLGEFHLKGWSFTPLDIDTIDKRYAYEW